VVAFDINMPLALEAVQQSLRNQMRPPLATTDRPLLAQLAEDGKLLDHANSPINPGATGKKTRDVRLSGATVKAFRVAAGELIDPHDPSARSPAARVGRPPD